MSKLRAALFLLLVSALGAASKPARADKKTLRLVEFFLRTPTADLPPDQVPAFVAVDADGLPRRLRERFEAKRFELYTLKKIAGGKKKGFVRTPTNDPDCGAVEKPTEGSFAKILLNPGLRKWMGYEEISPDDLKCLERKTRCTPGEMMCEFTLKIVREKRKRRKSRLRFFLHGKDALTGPLGVCRSGIEARNTDFFGLNAMPTCSQ